MRPTRPTWRRQRDKIVSAINTANADIVSLEELENSAKFGKTRDFAITQLVNALNVGEPRQVGLRPVADGRRPAGPGRRGRDPHRLHLPAGPRRAVGASKILVGSAAFGNAREPLAQAFKKVGSPNADGFAVVVNHFKSKGSGADDGTGQGNANPDRRRPGQRAGDLRQPVQDRPRRDQASSSWVTSTPTRTRTRSTSSTGAGYTELHSTTDPDEESYNFDGQIGSLDHVLANAAAAADVTGVDVWPINGYESVYYEYSRYNYNTTNLYANNPFRSSDHSPEIVGIDVPPGRAGDARHPDPGHERLPRSAAARRRWADGWCCGAGRCGQAAACGEPGHGVRGGG